MTKDELVTRCTLKLGTLERPLVDVAVNAILETMKQALVDDRHIEIRGFGSYSVRTLKAGMSRNPKTGETFQKPERKSVHFKPGKEMRERVNGGQYVKVK